MQLDWAQSGVEAMSEAGFDANLKVIPDLGHRLNAMRERTVLTRWRTWQAMRIIEPGDSTARV